MFVWMSALVMASPSVCVNYVSSVKVVEWPPFWKELLTRLTVFSLYICIFVILDISYFGFGGRILVPIVPVPGIRLTFTFQDMCF